MKLGAFTLTIPEGHETADGYVELAHGTQYTLHLANTSYRCDAEVYIDGDHVGTWRIKRDSSIIVERPVHDTGRFTFYRAETTEALNAQISVGDETGLIRVVFKPERQVEYVGNIDGIRYSDAPREDNCRPGGTGLSGSSEQKFTTVEPLDFKPSETVTINLRLVCRVSDARPMFPRSTPVPPRVG